jgi:hypothetical protein
MMFVFSFSKILQLSHTRSMCHSNSYTTPCYKLPLLYVLPGPPSSANLRTMLGPISSYSAFVWQ